MEFVILGYLIMKSLSQYELKKILEKKVSPFYSASLGSIQSALKKLLKKGLITVEKKTANGRQKNTYSINEAGKTEFFNWMVRPINSKKLDAESSTKLFFLGLVNSKQQIMVVGNIIKCIQAQLSDYKKIDTKLYNRHIDDKVKEVAKFQFKSLDLGIYGYECSLKWYEELLKELEEQR